MGLTRYSNSPDIKAGHVFLCPIRLDASLSCQQDGWFTSYQELASSCHSTMCEVNASPRRALAMQTLEREAGVTMELKY